MKVNTIKLVDYNKPRIINESFMRIYPQPRQQTIKTYDLNDIMREKPLYIRLKEKLNNIIRGLSKWE